LGRSKIVPREYIIDLLKYIISASIKERLFGTFGKFLVVGGIGFFIQLVVYRAIITATNLPLGLANLISAQLAIFSNYNLNNLWTFKHEKAKGLFSYFVKMFGFFASSNIGVLIIQSGLVQLGEILFGRKFPLPYVYFVLATGVLLIYNFTMYRFVIWRKKPR
jgi:dolichol-phosphate mannosyltransferase